MKKITYVVAFLCLLIMTSCGGSQNGSTTQPASTTTGSSTGSAGTGGFTGPGGGNGTGGTTSNTPIVVQQANTTVPTGYQGQDANFPVGDSANPNDPNDPIDDGVIASPNRTDWLTLNGNQWLRNGQPWQGRGITLHDTRSCDFCTYRPAIMAEEKRKIDVAVNEWHVNFIRLLLESYPSAAYTDGGGGTRVQWASLMADPNYLHDIREIVEYIGTKPGVYVEVSIWRDPNFTVSQSPNGGDTDYTVQGGLPDGFTEAELATLTQTFLNDAQVILSVANEPEGYTDNLQATCQASMSAGVQAVRNVERAAGSHAHVVAVQGTEGWARLVSYYVTNPIVDPTTNQRDTMVAYESHAYTATSNFQTNLWTPQQTLPLLIGEFGPSTGADMTLQDCQNLMNLADQHNVPWVAWDFHTDCSDSSGDDNMLLQNNVAQCIYGAPLVPTAWGAAVLNYITSQQ